jgi:hypothetical protein
MAREKVARNTPRPAAEPPPAAPPPLEVPLAEPPPAATGDAVVDAGLPLTPYARMEEALFVKAFGGCFSAGQPATTGDGQPAATQVLKTGDEACRAKFAPAAKSASKVLFLFAAGRLWGTAQEDQTVVDAGTRLVGVDAGEPVVLDAGFEQRLVIPGAPTQ